MYIIDIQVYDRCCYVYNILTLNYEKVELEMDYLTSRFIDRFQIHFSLLRESICISKYDASKHTYLNKSVAVSFIRHWKDWRF